MTTSDARRRVQLAATAAGGAATLGAGLLVAAPAGAAPPSGDLQEVRAATARFHSVQQATRAGYHATPECVSSPLGGMGVHFENPALMADPEIDPLRPEILVYAPDGDGGLELVAVEYYRAATAGPATLFGRAFDGPMPAHHPGMAVHYDLHVWLWRDNPAGTFAQFNPAISCAEA